MTTHEFNIRTALLAAAWVVSGCAATAYEGKYDFSDGWRKAEVIEVSPASDLERPDFFTCVRQADPQQRSGGQFVVMKYLRMGKAVQHAQPLQPGQRWSPGDRVYVNLSDCKGEIVARSN